MCTARNNRGDGDRTVLDGWGGVWGTEGSQYCGKWRGERDDGGVGRTRKETVSGGSEEEETQFAGAKARPSSHLVVLVGCNSDEGGLWEDMGAEGCVLGAEAIVLICLHDVEPRLVLVHGVQDDLGMGRKRGQTMGMERAQLCAFPTCATFSWREEAERELLSLLQKILPHQSSSERMEEETPLQRSIPPQPRSPLGPLTHFPKLEGALFLLQHPQQGYLNLPSNPTKQGMRSRGIRVSTPPTMPPAEDGAGGWWGGKRCAQDKKRPLLRTGLISGDSGGDGDGGGGGDPRR